MKATELKPCASCGGPVAPIIYQITVKRFMVDGQAVQRQIGLAMHFSGNLELASVMGQDDSVTLELDSHTAIVCQDCGLAAFALVTDASEGDGA